MTTLSVPDGRTRASLLALDPEAQALLFTQARTANTFSDEPVSDDQLRAIYDLIKWGPTGANGQPLRVLFVRTPAGKERLLRHMSDGNKTKTASAPVTAVLAADLDYHEQMPRLMPHRPEMRDGLADYPGREGLATFSAALQAGYFLLGVRAAGLAAGPMGGFDGPGVDGEFFADRPWRSILVVNIGKPGEHPWFDRLPRLDYDDVVTHA